jgi:hypothetical protein
MLRIKILCILMEEEFRALVDFPKYAVSNFGRVKNVNTGRIMKSYLSVPGYHTIVLERKHHFVHRLVLTTFIENTESKACVDHINNIKHDNRLENLRYATHAENSRNARLSIKNTSGYKGVSYNKFRKLWRAHIRIDGVQICLGYFDTVEKAAEARIARANEVFGIFTNTIEKRVVTP